MGADQARIGGQVKDAPDAGAFPAMAGTVAFEEIVFSYTPDGTHESPFGPFTTNDGVLTVRNRDL